MINLEEKVRGIYKEHNALEIEEMLASYDLKKEGTKEGYLFKNKDLFIHFDLEGNIIDSNVDIPYFLQNLIKERLDKANNMLNLIWQ